MKLCFSILLAAALLTAKENTVSLKDAHEGWLLLFDGESLFGWTQPDAGRWRVVDGTLSSSGPDGLLYCNTPFSDFVLKFGFRAADQDRVGSVFVRTADVHDGSPKNTGYEVQLGNGSIVSVAKSEETRTPPNQWHATELEFSGDQMTVKFDGHKMAEGKDPRGKAGFIVFQGRLDLRNIKLKPTGMQRLFNGDDLSGWKPVLAPPPKPPSGMVKKVEKAIPGFGGGKKKEAQWTVLAGAIHGEGGSGQLEYKGATFDDFVLQAEGRFSGQEKREKRERVKAAFFLRGDPGKQFSGYEAPIDIGSGEVSHLTPPRKATTIPGATIFETIALSGRHFAVWVNGYPVIEDRDKRPDESSAESGARTAAGPVAVGLRAADGKVDFPIVSIGVIPKKLGLEAAPLVSKISPPSVTPPPPSAATQQPAPPVAPPPLPGPPPQRQQQVSTDPKQEKIASLMKEARDSLDPAEQKKLYDQVLSVDPGNVAATQGYNDARARIDQAAAQKQKEIDVRVKADQNKAADQSTGEEALRKGRAAFLARDYATAGSQLALADHLLPGNPEVRSLLSKVRQVQSMRYTIQYMAGGAGLAAMIGGIVLLVRSRGKKRPYLEIVQGMGEGKRYNLDQEVTHIGAVPQDGGARNEIVIQDVERKISRFHCEIYNEKGKLFLRDCNSANGTAVNGKKVPATQPMRLKNGFTVALAKSCTLRIGYKKKDDA